MTRLQGVLVGVLAAGALAAALSPAPAQPAQPAQGARITLVVPASAEVFFTDKPTKQKGSERLYLTPPLNPGRENYYEVVVRWQEGDKAIERVRKVVVKPGESVRINFTHSGPDTRKIS